MKKQGFTIIELIVVIAIIAVLAGIVMVNVTKYIQQAKDAAVLADLKQAKSAATGYYVENSSYAGFCNSAEMKKVGDAIHGTYNFSCYDSSGSYILTKNSFISYAYAIGSCATGQYIALVTKSAGQYMCTSSDANAVTGSGDVFLNSTINLPSGCVCN